LSIGILRGLKFSRIKISRGVKSQIADVENANLGDKIATMGDNRTKES
jgi:hypothetical protein